MKTRGSALINWLLLLCVTVTLMSGCGLQSQAPKSPPRKQSQTEPTITLYLNQTGETININLEDYVMGVVAAEMDPKWPVNALAAQAILARTFTLKKIQMGGVKAYGTDASTSVEEFQAYAPDKINENIRKSVAMTRGVVVTYGGDYINGWFHADAGGQTAASAVEGLDYRKEEAPYLTSVSDAGTQITEPENRAWTVRFASAKVRAAVLQITGKDPGALRTASVVSKGPSGRAMTIRINDVDVSAPALRLALGNDQMRSSLLSKLAVERGALVMSGKGYGHGVGMSQWGARYLAEQGKNPEQIVNYYFKDIKLEKVWP